MAVATEMERRLLAGGKLANNERYREMSVSFISKDFKEACDNKNEEKWQKKNGQLLTSTTIPLYLAIIQEEILIKLQHNPAKVQQYSE